MNMAPLLDTAKMIFTTHWLAAAIAILSYGVGFFSDLGKENIKRTLHLREEHAKEIFDHILSPIFDCLRDFYLPICELKRSSLEVVAITVTKKPVRVVDDDYVRTDHQLKVRIPARRTNSAIGMEYWQETEYFKRYYADALTHHHPVLLERWESFQKSFEIMADQCLGHAVQVSKDLHARIKLPAATASGTQAATWANYERLALFVQKRQLGIEEARLYFTGSERRGVSLSGWDQQVLQCTSPEEAQMAIAAIEKLAVSKAGVDPLIKLCSNLASEGNRLVEDFRHTLAQKSRPKGCPLVPLVRRLTGIDWL